MITHRREMQFLLLGPLAVYVGRAAVPVRPGKQRAVLAALLLSANDVVPADDLAEILWGAQPPPSAPVTLRNYVKRLRQSLGDAGWDRIATRARGYSISVDRGELDVTRFEGLLTAAHAAAAEGGWDRAAVQAREALSLWRGEPLADVQSQVLAQREIPRMTEMRLRALETRIEADLHVGRVDVVPELRRLAQAQPFREHVHALLMLALYRDGQRAEALAAYRHTRRALVSELGIEPGAELRELHQQILTGEVVAACGRGRPPGEARPAVPRQLPAPVAHFTGREGELAALDGLVDPHRAGVPGGAVIAAICGTAGAGKTELAVHWAHRIAQRFPDGQLYVNLRGYDPEQPVTAADALAGSLRALGVPGQEIPAEVAERIALYRSLLASRRMLVVLDNARETEQLRPLLPGSPACVTVVTSRDSLAGLVARDGARRLELDMLPAADALALLRTLVGDRVAEDPQAAAALASYCCRLPLALRIAAELAVARPAAALSDLVAELAGARRRLDLLDAGGDPRTAIRAVFSWSCRHLNAAAARAFRLAGLHPGPGLDVYTVAALTGATVEQATRTLDQLARAHLIQATGPGRYSLHDLLRAYAAEQAAAEGGEKERRAALTRLFDFYLRAAHVAMDVVFPAEHHRRPSPPGATTAVPPLADVAAAGAWLDAERENLAAVVAHTAGDGWPEHAIRLSATVFRYLEVAGHYPEIRVICGHARWAAREAADQVAEAGALHHLSMADLHQGRYRQATERMRQALALWQRAGDATGQARVLANLGIVGLQQGRYRQAAASLRRALVLYRESGDGFGEGRALNNLGLIQLRQGRYLRAAECFGQALALHRQVGDTANETACLANVGVVHLREGDYEQAAGRLGEALELSRRIGMPLNEAYSLTNLGLVDLRLGRHQRAISRLRQALALCRQLGERSSEAEARNGLGAALLAAGRPGDARSQHATALSLATQMGEIYEQARAHDGLAATYHATGDAGNARRHQQHAAALYTRLGAPEADQVRARLNRADHDRRR